MALTMRPEIRDELVKRLRSGKYIQGKEKLALADGDGMRYCCLGVLCEMAVEAGVTQRIQREEARFNEADPDGPEIEAIVTKYGRDGRAYDATLPPEVAVWAGMATEEDVETMSGIAFDDGPGMGRFSTKDNNLPTFNTLAGLNDDGKPFAEIATFIEANAVVVE